jgi:hypothetical protein
MHGPATVIGATPIDNPSAPADRVREIDRFRNDPDCWVLIATPQTLGEGISLHRTCTDQIHVDRGYAAGTWLQPIDRTHRLGLAAGAKVTCPVIEAEDTIDSRVSDVLNNKVAAMASALGDHALRPVVDPTIVPGDPIAAVLGISMLSASYSHSRGRHRSVERTAGEKRDERQISRCRSAARRRGPGSGGEPVVEGAVVGLERDLWGSRK